MFDIFICDLLEQPDDEMSYEYLKVVPEAQMGVTAKDVIRWWRQGSRILMRVDRQRLTRSHETRMLLDF